MPQLLRRTIAVVLIVLPLGGLYFLNYLSCNLLWLVDSAVAHSGKISQKSFWMIFCTGSGALVALLYAHRELPSEKHKLYCKIAIVVIVGFSTAILS